VSKANTQPLTAALLRVPDVAALLSVKASTVYEWVAMNYIPHIRIGTGKQKPCVRFDASEIAAWLAAKKEAGRVSRFPEKFVTT
jgi:excisionase family DNA binding protein